MKTKKLKQWLKQFSLVRIGVLFFVSLRTFRWNIFVFARELLEFLSAYRRQKENQCFSVSWRYWYPILHERRYYTKLDPVYFYQDAWCAKKIFEHKPVQHIDIASNLKLVSIISQFVPVIFVDIHKPAFELPSLEYRQADARALPFQNASAFSISSICVIEHIGLGRYGDPVDAFGSEKTARELVRVLAPKGNLYVSLPVDRKNQVCFNAHRVFTRDYIIQLFAPLKLVEEQYLYKEKLYPDYDPQKGFGTGMFYFKKE